MLYEIDADGLITRTTFHDDMTASLARWTFHDEDYAEHLGALQQQDYEGYETFAEPAGPFTAPWNYTPPEMPEGTKLLVQIESGEVFNCPLDETLTLADPGKYVVQLWPPAPDRGFVMKIEVTG